MILGMRIVAEMRYFTTQRMRSMSATSLGIPGPRWIANTSSYLMDSMTWDGRVWEDYEERAFESCPVLDHIIQGSGYEP